MNQREITPQTSICRIGNSPLGSPLGCIAGYCSSCANNYAKYPDTPTTPATKLVTERPSRDEILLRAAELFALRGTCNRPNNGAVIARDGRIISVGYSGSPSSQKHCTEVGCLIGPDGGCIRTIHAEANAIVEAARLGISTNGANLYCTSSPCYTCAKLIIAAGIKALVYRNTYRDPSGIELLKRDITVVRLEVNPDGSSRYCHQ